MKAGSFLNGFSLTLREKSTNLRASLSSLIDIIEESTLTSQIGKVLTVNLLIAMTGLGSGLLAARTLGPRGRGELAAIQSWPMLFAAVAMLGMPEAVVYFASRERNRAADYLGTARIIALLASAVFMATGWILMPMLLRSQSDSTILFARIFTLIIPIYALIDLPRNVLRAVGQWEAWNALRLIHSALWLAVLLGFSASPNFASPGAVACMLIAVQCVFGFPHSWAISRYVRQSYRWSSNCRRPLLAFGLPTMMTILPQTLNLRLDQLLMSSFMAPEPLGFYIVAVAWASAAAPLFQSAGIVLFPHVSALSEAGSIEPLLKTYIPKVLLLITAISSILVVVTPAAINLLFGPGFARSIPAAMILLVASGFSGLNSTLSSIVQGLGQPAVVLRAELAGLLVTLISLALLLPAFGIIGAAVSSLLAYCVTTITMTRGLLQWVSSRHT